MADPIDHENISPKLQETYRNEFARGVKLFQDSLVEYEKSQNEPQKEKFKDVMNKALNIMNESARGFLSTRGKEDQKTLETDYQNFLSKDTPENYQKLNADIENIKHYT